MKKTTVRAMKKFKWLFALCPLIIAFCFGGCMEKQLPLKPSNGAESGGGQSQSPADDETSEPENPVGDGQTEDTQTPDGQPIKPDDDDQAESEGVSFSYSFSFADVATYKISDGEKLSEGIYSDAQGAEANIVLQDYDNAQYSKYAVLEEGNAIKVTLPADAVITLYAVNIHTLFQSVVEVRGAQFYESFPTSSNTNESGVRNSYDIFSCKVRKGEYTISSPNGAGLLYISVENVS